MKNTKKSVASMVVLVSLALVAVLVGNESIASAAENQINLKAAHVMSELDPYHLGIKRFCDLVTERTGGRMKFTIYPNKQLGAERDIVEGVSMGTIDVAVVTNALCVNLAPELGVLDFPYLFKSKQDAYKLLDSEIGKELLATLTKANIKGLAFMENGMRNLNTVKALVTNPEQIKKMKIRTMETPIHMAAFNAAGANATPVSASELYTSLQQGVVDAEENPLKSIYDYKFFEVAPFITMTEHFYSTVNLIINMNVWKSLSPKDQTIMEKAASEATIYQRERCAIREKEAKELMLKKGVTIFDKVDKNAWEKAMSPVYKDKKLVEKYGYWLEKIKKYSGK